MRLFPQQIIHSAIAAALAAGAALLAAAASHAGSLQDAFNAENSAAMDR